MNVIQLLRDQLKWSHETLEATMADVQNDHAHFTDTNKALPVGAAYAHAVMGEDVVVATMLAKTQPVSAAMETGLSVSMPSMQEWDKHEEWARTVKVDLPKFKVYAQKVYGASDTYLATLKEVDLNREMEVGNMGKQTLVWVLSNFIILHNANLTGEISAAKGLQGLKGYPF